MYKHSPDQDLLLLAHGELAPGRRLLTQAHVAFCAQCQTRLEKLTGASRLLADAIRGHDLPRWSSPGPEGVVAAARMATFWRIGAVMLIALTLLVTIQAVRIIRPHNSPRQTAPAGGCRPDLPNDRCR